VRGWDEEGALSAGWVGDGDKLSFPCHCVIRFTLACLYMFLMWHYSELIDSLLDTMHQSGADFNNTFRGLSRLQISPNVSESTADVKSYLLRQCATLEELQNAYSPRMDPR